MSDAIPIKLMVRRRAGEAVISAWVTDTTDLRDLGKLGWWTCGPSSCDRRGECPCGRPVVVTFIGAVQEVVVRGVVTI